MDVCITAVEKYHADMEKCTQVGSPGGGGGGVCLKRRVCAGKQPGGTARLLPGHTLLEQTVSVQGQQLLNVRGLQVGSLSSVACNMMAMCIGRQLWGWTDEWPGCVI